MLSLSKIGLDGVLLSRPRSIDGMREFRDVAASGGAAVSQAPDSLSSLGEGVASAARRKCIAASKTGDRASQARKIASGDPAL